MNEDFTLQIECEGYGFSADLTDKLIRYNLNSVSLSLSLEDVNLIIEKLYDFKFLIEEGRKNEIS